MTAEAAVVHVLPGMGATSAMFTGAWREIPGACFHDWPPYAGELTVGDVAERMVAVAGVRPGDAVVGVSLGGMVACEIASRVPLRRVVLVSSATRSAEISGLLRALGPLVDVMPFEWVRRAAGTSGAAPIVGDLAAMLAANDADFVRAMCRAVLDWPGLAPHVDRPYRIHGGSDRTIPAPADADLLLDGGHLVAITHAHECAAAVSAALQAVGPSR